VDLPTKTMFFQKSGCIRKGKVLSRFNPLSAELNPICNLLALLGAHLIFHVSGLRVNLPRAQVSLDKPVVSETQK
jgi:hypothetical protein